VEGQIELYAFDSGTLGLNGFLVPVPFFLIHHPDGDVIVDGGNPLEVARDAHAHWGALASQFEVHMREDQHCAAQLSHLGVAPASIRHIVQTHLHIDHTGALGHFPDADVVVHARELEAAMAAEAAEWGYVRADYDRPELRWRQAEGDLDLYGDGVIQLLETPGHSAGHMSVLVSLPQTGPILLTADASDNRRQWDGRDHVRALFSREHAARSMARLRSIATETGAMIVFGHDPKNWAQLEHAPASYR
jgi:glyoxylase-like metal-dependent hydrolase (beta-lactamase superfamily II)